MEAQAASSSSGSSSPGSNIVDPDIAMEVEQDTWSPPDPEILDSYMSLMSDRLPSIKAVPMQAYDNEESTTITNADGTSRPMTKAEKQNAKKKRRKERERDEKAQAVQQQRADMEFAQLAKPIEFRLFSSCPIKQVSILPPVEDYPIPCNPRHEAPTPTQLELVRRIASEAAASFPSLDPISLYSTYFDPCPRPHRLKRVHVKLVRSLTPVKARIVIAQSSDLSGKQSVRGVERIKVESISPPAPRHNKRQRSKRPRREV